MADDSAQKYRVLFKGEIEAGQELQTVKEHLAQLFKAPPEKIDLLFSGKPFTLNHNLDHTAAQKYLDELKNAGAMCTIEPMPEQPPILTNIRTIQSTSASKSGSNAPSHPSQQNNSAIRAAISPSSYPYLYTTGWVLVAAGMILLFIIYIFFTLFIADTTYNYIEDNISLLDESSLIFGLLLYVIPIFFGIMLTIAMLKPFFAGSAAKRFSISVPRKKEPALFAFIEKLCQSIGSKTPSNIEIDCSINISAGYHRGLISFLEDNLTLTIGLPIVSEMSMMEFGSLLAHEFGHFTKKIGMRLYYIITSVNTWFADAVYQKDKIDQKMSLISTTSLNFMTRLPVTIAIFFVWLSRKILFLFMLAGQGLSRFYARQMEFDADRFAIRFSGTEAFESSINKLYILSRASKDAFNELKAQKKPSDNSLPDDFILLISSIIHEMSEDTISKIKEDALSSKAGIVNTRPTNHERIENVKNSKAKSIFQSDKPATSLYSNFSEMAKNATVRMYREVLGLQFGQKSLVPTHDFANMPVQAPGTSGTEINTFF